MSVSVHTGELAQTLRQVASIIPARVVIPVLGNILLRADGDQLTATASNLDGWFTSTVSANVAAPFSACADSRIAKVVSALPEDRDCTLELKDGALHLRCGRSRYKFECVPAEDFPEAPEFDDGVQIHLSDADVRRLFNQAATATSDEETRYYLGGVCLEIDGGQPVRATSTDGHIFIQAAVTTRADAEVTARRPIIPAKACKAIAGMGACTIRIDDRLIEVRTEGQVLINRLIDHTYPDYARVIPAPSDNSAEVLCADVLDALERMKHVGDRDLKVPGVKIEWDGDGLRLSAKLPGAGEDTIEATTSGTASFSCNIKKLTDLLRAIGTERVTLDHREVDRGIRIGAVGDDDVFAICMPTRW
jgi:DNA polymerase III subunit beta